MYNPFWDTGGKGVPWATIEGCGSEDGKETELNDGEKSAQKKGTSLGMTLWAGWLGRCGGGGGSQGESVGTGGMAG